MENRARWQRGERKVAKKEESHFYFSLRKGEEKKKRIEDGTSFKSKVRSPFLSLALKTFKAFLFIPQHHIFYFTKNEHRNEEREKGGHMINGLFRSLSA